MQTARLFEERALELQTMATSPDFKIVIIGGGIAGLTLALSLRKHLSITASVYEQAPRFGTLSLRISVLWQLSKH